MAAQPYQAWRWPDSGRLRPCLRVSWRDAAEVPRRPPGWQRAGTGWTWCPRYPSTFGSAGAQLAAAIAATAAWLRSQIKA
jgi:hypothetical protein